MDNIDYKAKVGFVPAGDGGRVTIVLSFASESPSLLGAEACGAKNALAKDVPAKSGAEASEESIIKKDPSAEAPAAGAVDSDKAKAMFATHVPRPTAVFWSKFPRPTGPPTDPTGAVVGALKKDIPAAESGAEASVDETGAIKNLGDDGWTVSAKEFPKETPAPAGEPDWIVSNSRNKTERKGEVKSTKVSNKYDLLDDVETNVKAEIDEDEDEKKKEKGKEKESEKESSFESVSPESVGGNGKAAVDETEPTSAHAG